MNLKSIYETENSLKTFMQLEPLHFYLRTFFLDSIRSRDTLIDPFDFSYKYNLDTLKSLNLFLILAKHGLLIKFYNLECDECGETTIEDSIDKFYECINCKSLLLNLKEPNTDNLFSNISYLFKLSDEILDELQQDLKVQPSLSSEPYNDKEGDATTVQKSLVVTEIVKHTDNTLTGLASEKNILQQQINNLLGEGIRSIS